jgi:crossover junction endodeoxyribonuclease RuvC
MADKKKAKTAQVPDQILTLQTHQCPRVFALDLSLTGTGFANWGPAKMDLGCTEGLIASSPLKGPARLGFIRDKIRQLVVQGGSPDRTLVLIENYAFGKSNQAHQMGELGGVIRLMLHEEGYKYFVVTPTRLKKFLTGKGVAEKNLMLKELFKVFGHDVNDDNIADALVLMELGRAMIGHPSKELPKYRREVVEEVLRDLSKLEE